MITIGLIHVASKTTAKLFLDRVQVRVLSRFDKQASSVIIIGIPRRLMDNNTWQQGNSGSTGIVRSLQSLQHQQLSSSVTGSVYPGSISTISNQTGSHWPRIACCNSLNGVSSSPSHLLTHQQQSQQNQIQQQQQTAQLRYFQLQKSTNPQYSIQHQQFAQHYALLTASSSSAAVSSSNSIIPERSSNHNCEALSYSGCYLASPFQSTHKSTSIAQALALKSAEERQLQQHHHHHHPNNNHQLNQNNQQKSLSALSPAYQPRYQIIANSNFAIPANGELSLTTCFALTSTNATSFEASLYSSASPSLNDQVSLLPKIIPAYRRPSLPRFVNAFEAVPDMLQDIRPGNTWITPRFYLPTPILVGEKDFSYHVSKPQLTVRLQTALVATVESNRDKNWPELSFKSQRAHLTSNLVHQDVALVLEKGDKRVWKRIAIEENCRENTLKTTRRSVKHTCSGHQKTYAAAVQLTGRQDIGERSYEGRTIMSELWSNRLRIQEANNVNTATCATSFHTSTPNKMEVRGLNKKREYDDSCEEDNEYSSASTLSSGTIDTLPRTPERFSSPDGGASTNRRASSSTSSLPEMEEEKESFDTDEHGSNAPSRKRLCKMAESFCFGQLENEAFFRAFDEYNLRRRRMSYTQKLEDGQDDKFFEHEEAVTAENLLSLSQKMEVLVDEISPRFQSVVFADLQENGLPNTPTSSVQIQVNGVQDQGAFKVLQKLKESPDGTGALYTNSWRPEELHFLRRCYQNKNI